MQVMLVYWCCFSVFHTADNLSSQLQVMFPPRVNLETSVPQDREVSGPTSGKVFKVTQS